MMYPKFKSAFKNIAMSLYFLNFIWTSLPVHQMGNVHIVRSSSLENAIQRNKNAIHTAIDLIFNDMATSGIEGNHRRWRNPRAQWGPSTS